MTQPAGESIPTITNPSIPRLGRVAAVLLVLAIAPPAFAGQAAYTEGVEAALIEDYKTAYAKWEPLLAGNDGRAQFQLALMYHAGLFVPMDEKKAVELYHMAARNGVPEAQEFLVAAYENGWFGLPKNIHLSAFWQRQARLAG